ncbi:TlpA family protein disulfide reductase [bacterium]|nr:TlpA family protein disulfide reductase [bacterium]
MSKNNIFGIFFIVIAVLCISNISLIVRVNSQNKKIAKLSYKNRIQQLDRELKAKKLPDFTLKDIEGNLVNSDSILHKKPYTLFVFFSPSDCGSCLMERFFWQKIADKRDINVIGVTNHNLRELKKWLRQAQFNIPILHDKKSELYLSIGINKTPAKVLVDTQQRIYFIDTNNYIYRDTQKYFLRLIDEVILKDKKSS